MFFTVITILFVLLFCILSLFMLPLTFFIRKANPLKGDLMSLHFVQWAFRVVIFLSGIRVTLRGEENIPTDRPVLFIGNHRSIFDIVITYAQVKGRTGYISKDSIKKLPVISIWMERLYCLFMKREDLKQSLQIILTSIDYIKQGISICIFPEGTRNKGSEPVQPFHAGSFKPAEKTGCDIIPMAIAYDKPVFEEHLPWLYRTKVVLTYGAPIPTSGLSRDEKKALPERVRSCISDMYIENVRILSSEKESGEK